MGAHFAPPPPAAVTRVLSRFDRAQLAGFIAIAIDLLDVADGDADLEANGDEMDASVPEGSWRTGVIDPRHRDHDDAEDDDSDCCPARDDVGTDHYATRKIGFDGRAGLTDDDAEDTFDREQTNEDGSDAVYATLPRYDVDQSAGPINHRDVVLEHTAAELGLVRSQTGGWRHPSVAAAVIPCVGQERLHPANDSLLVKER